LRRPHEAQRQRGERDQAEQRQDDGRDAAGDRRPRRALRNGYGSGTLVAGDRRCDLLGLLHLGEDRQHPGRIGQRVSCAKGELFIYQDELGANRLLDDPTRCHGPPAFETERVSPCEAWLTLAGTRSSFRHFGSATKGRE